MNSIECNNLSKSFHVRDNKIDVFNNVNLSINEADLVAISGESGAGKSTLLHILASLDKPSDGEIFYDGHSINTFNNTTLSKHRLLNFGFVYQFHHLLPDLTALENIALPAMLSGIGKEEAFEISASLLEQVNLNDKKENRPNELSGGERQRVAIARAMSNNPSCLIMDEPTGNLDKKNVENFMNLLMDMVSTREIALIIATHDNNVSSRLDKLLNLE